MAGQGLTARRVRVVAVALLVLVGAFGLGCYGAWRLLVPPAPPPPPPEPVCLAHAGGEVRLSPEQMGNAATIASVGVRRGLPVRAIQVALVTAWQESDLTNLTGGDRDSVGLFQQRPSQGWGRADQLGDPRFATAAFYMALLKVHHWQDLSVVDAAQAVQRSAYPDAYGQWVDSADILARALTQEPDGAVSCTLAPATEPRGAAAVAAVTDGLRADWDVSVRPGARAAQLVVAPADATTGWRYGYWLVSHADECGITAVQVGARRWTAHSGRWTGAAPLPGPPPAVLIEVRPA